MDLQCHVCGVKFRTAIQEAKHRHNFPAMCRQEKLTVAQQRALDMFTPGVQLCAYRAEASLATLRALVRKGKLVDVTLPCASGMCSPRTYYVFQLKESYHA